MNKVALMGRLTRDPEIRYSAGENPLCIARYTLAVDRRFHGDGEASADFIFCVAFGKTAEFAEKYFRQGTRIAICGRIQTGSYINNGGSRVYTTEVVVEEQEFAESKAAQNSQDRTQARTQGKPQERPKPAPDPMVDEGGFMNIPEGLEEELPFT